MAKALKKNLRKCKYCGQEFDIVNEGYRKVGNRYAHIECYNANYTEDDEKTEDIYKFLKSVGISCNRGICENQRQRFITKNGFTNEGILRALKYWYTVKKMPTDKSENRIGIVPFIYDEAQIYYDTIENKKKIIAKDVGTQLIKEKVTMSVKNIKEVKDKGYIDLDSIIGGEENGR